MRTSSLLLVPKGVKPITTKKTSDTEVEDFPDLFSILLPTEIKDETTEEMNGDTF